MRCLIGWRGTFSTLATMNSAITLSRTLIRKI
jgi:hypothetical protein